MERLELNRCPTPHCGDGHHRAAGSTDYRQKPHSLAGRDLQTVQVEEAVARMLPADLMTGHGVPPVELDQSSA